MSILGRLRERRNERAARAFASRIGLFGSFVTGRRVLYDLDHPTQALPLLAAAGAAAAASDRRRPGAYDVVVASDPSLVSRLVPGGLFLSPSRPSGLAAVRRFAGEIWLGSDDSKWRDLRLHLGSGPVTIPGWVNVDNLPYPGVDLRWDLARGLPFEGVQFVFAEHFIEHLSFEQAERFVRACRAALGDDGVLRLSTPNLDWVWETSYHPHGWKDGVGDPLHDCFVLNRAFHGWGHQFLYNVPVLTHLLQAAGFDEIRQVGYGQSSRPELQGLERHEQYPDAPGLPHIVIVEASGRRAAPAPSEPPIVAEFRRDVAVK